MTVSSDIELVFIHGWGFDAGVWDRLAEHLSDYPQRRLDLGFFPERHSGKIAFLPQQKCDFIRNPVSSSAGNFLPIEKLDSGSIFFRPASLTEEKIVQNDVRHDVRRILIGHSLGFLHGLMQHQDWAGWVAINGFRRFTPDCVPPAALRDMRRRLSADPEETLRRFYATIGIIEEDTERLSSPRRRGSSVVRPPDKDLHAPQTRRDWIPAFAGMTTESWIYKLKDHTNQPRLRDGLDELRDGDATGTLSSLQASGLVLASRNDPLVPVAATEALASASSATLAWHETGGHILPLSDPEWCAEQIKNYVKNVTRECGAHTDPFRQDVQTR